MGFWDFFRRKSESVENEKIKLDEIQSWLETKKTKIEKQEKNFLKIIQTKISEFIQELKEKLSALREVDVKERKAEEKIKFVVEENLKIYIEYVEKLIDKLVEVNEKTEKDIIEKINLIFSDFQKKSALNYEKVTFLIGKEMGDIKDSLRKFFKNIEEIVKEHQDVVDKSKIIRLIEVDIKKSCEITKNIEISNDQINNLKENAEAKKGEIESIEKSEKFIEESKKRQELKTKRQELETEIGKLGVMIDFKALTKFYHSFEKEMGIVKEYRENFKHAFKKSNGEDILSLLREAKLHNVNILNKIQEIEQKRKELNNIEETGFENFENAIKKIKLEIGAFNSEKFVIEKKLKKLEGSLKEITNSIKDELEKIGVDVE